MLATVTKSWQKFQFSVKFIFGTVCLRTELIYSNNYQNITKNYEKLPNVAKTYQKLPKVGNSYHMLPKVIKSCQKIPKVGNSYQKLTKDTKSWQQLPKVDKSYQQPAKAIKSYQIIIKCYQNLPIFCKICLWYCLSADLQYFFLVRQNLYI